MNKEEEQHLRDRAGQLEDKQKRHFELSLDEKFELLTLLATLNSIRREDERDTIIYASRSH